MSDSAEVEIDLRDIPSEDLRKIDHQIIRRIEALTGDLVSSYPPSITVANKVNGSRTEIKIIWEDVDGAITPRRLRIKLNAPNFVAGHNCLHETAIPAVADAALAFGRAVLASSIGVEATNLLTLDHVTLRNATVTYLIPCGGRQEAFKAALDVGHVVDVLHGTPNELGSSRVTLYKSSNPSFAVEFSRHRLIGYVKVNLRYCRFAEGSPASEIAAEGAKYLRLEVTLSRQLLANPPSCLAIKGQSLTNVQAWNFGHANGLYERLYRWGVLEQLGLLLPPSKVSTRNRRRHLRARKPEADELADLSHTTRRIVEDYLAGKPVQPSTHVRNLVRREVRIDLDVPWETHRTLHCDRLAALLRYPGRYRVPEHLAPWCFCEASWEQKKRELFEANL